ncbi:MAG TPA: M3 family oligoendopeptidase, partial [Anaerolineales bacterium]|nr:M3 family oligoendopeptidase [Anaerolineales bacterium]
NMPAKLPSTVAEIKDWPWSQLEPFYAELGSRALTSATLAAWMADWSDLQRLVSEWFSRLSVAITVDTTDQEAERRYKQYLDEIYPRANEWNQKLKEKLLASGLEPTGFAVPLRNMRTEAAIFRQENLALESEELKLGTEFDKTIGAQTVQWEGQELTISQLRPIYLDPDRSRREKAWRLGSQRQLADRQTLNGLFNKFLALRRQMAANAGFSDYRAYRWKQYLRFDYTPENCRQFHTAIEQVVVPAAEKIYARRKAQLGVDSLRPWDLEVDPLDRPALRPFSEIPVLEGTVESIFHNVDDQLGKYFGIMRREKLLDLENRKGKAPGGYCTDFSAVKRPFIFMNAVGLHDDVQTLLHEGGHSFHVFETASLPYYQQLQVPMEFAEVASMGMELLAAPYLADEQGGFYTPADAARARIEHLEGCILFWPYMAVVDAFQHWVYENPDAAVDSARCDQTWGGLWDRFMRGVDWSGLEEEKITGWHRKLHIFQVPFYYVEYGLAQLGAMQIWRNALQDQAKAVANYRKALALGGTVTLPELYTAAGAKFTFDPQTLGEVVDLAMETIDELEKVG